MGETEIKILKASLKACFACSGFEESERKESTTSQALKYIELLESVLMEIHSRFYSSWDFNEWINICYASKTDDNQDPRSNNLSDEYIKKLIDNESYYIGDSYYGGDYGIAKNDLKSFVRKIESESKKINGIA